MNAQKMISFDNVSIVFGDHPDRALPLMDEGQDRSDIQKSTGQILGTHNCSLDVMQGEISVLMGLSGSGKSTLLRAVNGLNKVTRGSVLVRGRDAVVGSRDERRCSEGRATGTPANESLVLPHLLTRQAGSVSVFICVHPCYVHVV